MTAVRQATVIREAVPADGAAIFSLLIEVATQSRYTGGVCLNVPHVSALVSALLEHPQAGFLVAEHDGALVGVLAVMVS